MTKHQRKSARFNLYVLLFLEAKANTYLVFPKAFHDNVNSKSAQLSKEVSKPENCFLSAVEGEDSESI